MRISPRVMAHLRLLTVLAVAVASAIVLGFLWVGAGGRIPLVSDEGYLVSVRTSDVGNLAAGSDVMVAGVPVGTVAAIDRTDAGTHVTLRLDRDEAPLHEGAEVTVRYKTLLQETFLELADGDGGPLAAGSVLPEDAVTPAVDLNDILVSLDRPSRQDLAQLVRSLGDATEDTGAQTAAMLDGLGHVGREGRTALEALAEQSAELRRLTGSTATLLTALDTGRGRIATLVGDANQVTAATAASRDSIEAVMRRMPGLLDAAKDATGDLDQLSGRLLPVAANLEAAAPDLTAALRQLPGTTRDLRGLLPSLDGVLDKAPGTLQRVPAVSADVRALIPNARAALADVNPMLAYLRPYGRDIAAWFSNTAAAVGPDAAGRYSVRFSVVPHEQAVRGVPGGTEDLSPRRNPYPRPGQAENPAPFQGEYPRVEKDGN